MADRTVHARYPGMEIVRYDLAGKWYLEPLDPRLNRQHVYVRAAAQSAVWGEQRGGEVFLNLPGGGAFDERVRVARSAA